MKNYTPARQKLKSLGWNRRDRAVGSNESVELWEPPHPGIGLSPLPVSFSEACRRAGVVITDEDLIEREP